MPYEVVEERCEQADGTVGGYMIYKLEGEERVPFACHLTSENAYGVIARIEAEESKAMDEMKELQEGQLVHWISEEDEGFGRIESIQEGTYTVRVYAQAGEEFTPTDTVLELPSQDVHDYMSYMAGELEDAMDDLEFELEDDEDDELEDLLEDEESVLDMEMDEEEMEAKQVDLQPTQEMADEAAQGLEWRDEYGRGGTEVGVARARDISNRRELSEDTIQRMVSYFARHEVDLDTPENSDPDADGYPGAGLIAWKLWGGDPGKEWSLRKQAELEGEAKAEIDELAEGDFVEWDSAGGKATGKIETIRTQGTLNVPDSDFELEASEEDPAYLIEVYERVEGGWRPSGVMVGHRAGELRKIEPLELAELKRRILARFKQLDAQIEEEDDMKVGRIEGLASTYGNTDLGGDVVEKGAFKQTLFHSDTVPLLLDHNYTTAGVAGVAKLEDRKEGLYLKAEMPLDVPEVAAAYSKIKFMIARGAKMGLSIGYDTVKSEPAPDGTRKLKEIALHEVSVTPFPMNTEAQIMSAKASRLTAKAKQSLWQTIAIKQAEPAKQENDAPQGNQDQQDAAKALVDKLTKLFDETIEDIKQALQLEINNE